MKKLYFLLGLVLIYFQGYAQVIYGVNNYTQYHPGTLPIIISVPHGGLVAPATIPNRTCNNPTTVTDSKTIELARQIDTSLFNLTGCHPHLIICNLRRTKVDCNRNIADGACGNSDAEIAWTEFQNFIDTAQCLAKSQFLGKAFYIDLHGHGKPIQRLELGYGLSGTMLDNTDSALNTSTYISSSSIQNLVTTNVSGSTHAQLLRGVNALGTLLASAGFPAVPSQQTPGPGGTAYFSGGYNTVNHTCILPGNTVNGLQIECDSTVRSSYLNRKIFADSLASSLSQYLFIHQNISLDNCNLVVAPTITGNAEVCTGQTQTYTAPAGASAYTWTVTGGTIVNGQGTANIQVQWSNDLVGNVSVTFTP
ncbi:MAG: hypothetical protein IPN94_10955 [Sphingobacteriales bacterium]|nr:hypothetical protein [Sphingobacteriales bacterium]